MFVADTVFLDEMGLPGFWFFCSLGFIDGPTCLVFGWKREEMVKKNKKEFLALGLFVIYRLLSDGKMKELGISMFGFCPLSFIVKFSVSFF